MEDVLTDMASSGIDALRASLPENQRDAAVAFGSLVFGALVTGELNYGMRRDTAKATLREVLRQLDEIENIVAAAA